MTDTRTVRVVDDSRVSRLMARQFILSNQPGWTVIEAATVEDALDKARSLSPC
jgi:DNA-binding NarL/FixJ family response regulator